MSPICKSFDNFIDQDNVRNAPGSKTAQLVDEQDVEWQ
jgi:hypothetical protein